MYIYIYIYRIFRGLFFFSVCLVVIVQSGGLARVLPRKTLNPLVAVVVKSMFLVAVVVKSTFLVAVVVVAAKVSIFVPLNTLTLRRNEIYLIFILFISRVLPRKTLNPLVAVVVKSTFLVAAVVVAVKVSILFPLNTLRQRY